MGLPLPATARDAAAAAAAAPATVTYDPQAPWVQRVPWFGGAMSASLPATFLDASDLRPVPDHQEMWHDAQDQGAAVLDEIVEHDAAVADSLAGAHFFGDAAEGAESLPGLAAMDHDGGGATGQQQLPAPLMPGGAATAGAGGAFVAGSGRGGGEGGGGRGQLVAAALAVFRVPRVQSDIVITSFQPAGDWPSAGAEEAQGGDDEQRHRLLAVSAGALAAARQRLARVVETVRVDDWGLFGGDGGEADA